MFRKVDGADVYLVEVVLATLLSTFKFELSDKPIYWNLAGIIYPTAALGGKTSMPLRVTLLKRESE